MTANHRGSGRRCGRAAGLLTCRLVATFVLLAFGRTAAGEPGSDDSLAIAAVMEAREGSTIPFELAYRVTDWREGGGEPHFKSDVTLSCSAEARLMRRILPLSELLIGGADPGARVENVLLEKDGRVVDVNRRLDTSAIVWHGKITRDRAILVDFDSILRFGLLCVGRPFSQLMTQEGAVALGRETVAGTPCVGFRLDVVGTGPAVVTPIDVWLSPAHGYYPMRIINYAKSGTPISFLATERIRLAGVEWGAVASLDIEKLVAVGTAWLPERASLRSRVGTTAREIRITVNPASVRHGADVAFHGDVPADIRRAVVRNELTGVTETIGVDPFAVASSDIDEVATLARAERTPPASPMQGIVATVLAIAGGLGLGFALLTTRRHRQGTP